MGDRTGIEWTDATWNPVSGCTKVSPGCDHCYAETIAERFRGTPGHYYENGFDVTLRPDKLAEPLRWTRPRRVFVNSMSDLFHQDIPAEYIARVFAVMALAPQHTFQVLTKRHGRMRSLLSSDTFRRDVEDAIRGVVAAHSPARPWYDTWPLPNVWLGVSTEDQHWANIRIPALLDTPAAVRFISAEPLLGPIDLAGQLDDSGQHRPRLTYWLTGRPGFNATTGDLEIGPKLDWVIVGGESGRGARPMHPAWARSLRDQCIDGGVPFLFKQRGDWTWNEPGAFVMPPKPYTDRAAVMHPGGMTARTKSNPFDPFSAGHPNWTTRIDRVGKKAAGRELDGALFDGYPDEGSES